MSTTELQAPRLDGPRVPRPRTAVAARPIPADVLAVGALVVIAVAIRILTINNQSLWADEALTAYEAHLPFGAMLNTVAHVETTPPGYFVLTWFWAKVFGTSAIALRSISSLAGVALVPIAYLSGRELVSRWTGVLAAAFVAVNPLMVWYSQEARAYMLLALLTGAGFWWFVRARRDPSRRNLTWWAILSALAIATHFFAGFVVAPEVLWLLWISRTRAVAIAVGVVVAAQVAMAPFAFIDTSHGAEWIGKIPRTSRVATLALEWSVGTVYRRAPSSAGLIGGAVVLVVVALLIRLAGDRRTREGARVAAVIASFGILVPLALGYFGQDYFLSRNVIPAFLPLVVVIAAACVLPRMRVVGGALAIALLVIFSVATARIQTTSYFQRPPWRDVANVLGATAVPRAILVADGTTGDPLKLYMPHVAWVQQHGDRMLISEVDVVGVRKKFRLVPGSGALQGRQTGKHLVGWPLPRSVAPPGTRILMRSRVDNWILSRFALAHPMRLSINDLNAMAGRFFSGAPQVLLVFMQQAGR